MMSTKEKVRKLHKAVRDLEKLRKEKAKYSNKEDRVYREITELKCTIKDLTAGLKGFESCKRMLDDHDLNNALELYGKKGYTWEEVAISVSPDYVITKKEAEFKVKESEGWDCSDPDSDAKIYDRVLKERAAVYRITLERLADTYDQSLQP